MQHLFGHLAELEKVLADSNLLLFFDYDGTLAPISGRPADAAIPSGIKALLERLSAVPGCRIVIISGRSLKDVKKMAGVKGVIYAGNHGLEIEGAKIKFKGMVSPGLKKTLRQLKADLESRLRGIKGVFVEDKTLTLSVHYRLAAGKDIPLIKNMLGRAVKPYIAANALKINPGKKVIEVKPKVNWHKGRAVLWLLARQQFAAGLEAAVCPIYLGDDITDEDAFRALKNKGITVFVGKPRASLAGYYLKDIREVARFITYILKLKKGTRACRN